MPQIKCRLILMAPDKDIMRNNENALVEAFGGGDVAALVVADQTPGFPPVGDEALKLAQAHDIACLKMGGAGSEELAGFDGVHLGENADIAAIRQTREMLGGNALIGAEAGNTRDDAMLRGEAGVDYIAFAPQDGKDIPALELISWWCDLFVVPCMAMGEITLQNAAPFIRAGVDFLMLPASIWRESGGPGPVIAEFGRLIDAETPS